MEKENKKLLWKKIYVILKLIIIKLTILSPIACTLLLTFLVNPLFFAMSLITFTLSATCDVNFDDSDYMEECIEILSEPFKRR